MKRRGFLTSAAGVGAAGLASLTPSATPAAEDAKPKEARPRKHPIGVSTYSFWGFRRDELRPIEKNLELAAEMGFEGVEILQVQMEDTSNAALQKIKRKAFVLGLDLMGFSTHQGFVSPDKEKRIKNINHTIDCIEQAYALGIGTMRVNTGRWGTSKNFDELMANKGIEPRLEGYTDDDGFGWVIDSYEKIVPHAEKCGVILGLENHWGLGLTPEGVNRVVDAIDSPWLQVTLDTGNFLDNQYENAEKIAPKMVLLQAKTYFGGGRWYTLDIDYSKVAAIMDKAGFTGWVSLEFEGKEDPLTGIPKSLDHLRQYFGHA